MLGSNPNIKSSPANRRATGGLGDHLHEVDVHAVRSVGGAVHGLAHSQLVAVESDRHAADAGDPRGEACELASPHCAAVACVVKGIVAHRQRHGRRVHARDRRGAHLPVHAGNGVARAIPEGTNGHSLTDTQRRHHLQRDGVFFDARETRDRVDWCGAGNVAALLQDPSAGLKEAKGEDD